MTPPEELYRGRGFRLARSFEMLLLPLVPIGLVLVIAGTAVLGVVLFAIGTIGATLIHFWVGLAGYRRAMRAEWPKVEPLSDDDW